MPMKKKTKGFVGRRARADAGTQAKKMIAVPPAGIGMEDWWLVRDQQNPRRMAAGPDA